VTPNSPSLGLDFALLEQQKAKLYESQDANDEVALEEIFQELSAPKKKTREELVAGLKKARSEGVPVDKPLEIAKQQGKFKSIGAPADNKPRKRKAKGDEKDGQKKKKKRKIEDAAEVQEGGSNPQPREEALPSSSKSKVRPRTPSPEIDPDADIFGDAEEYRGLPSGSDSEEEGQEPRTKAQASTSTRVPPTESVARKDWFGEKQETETPSNSKPEPQARRPATPEDHHMASGPEEGEEEEETRPVVRLQALASSAVPSVRDILAMDEAAEREEKRKAKKEKKKKKNPSEETKINREVKK
jgi:IK cytokine